MQPVVDEPRSTLTSAQVVAIIQGSSALTVSGGLELLDADLNKVEDISDDFEGGSVARASYATLHGSATLRLTRELDWGQALVRPYMVLSDGTTSARFNLGAYYTPTPKRDVGQLPVLYEVSAVDVLHLLADPVGDTYAADEGVAYLLVVEAILVARGAVYVIDQTAAEVLLPSPRVWAFDDKTTWLTVVNDLLGAVGYAGIWSDWDGRLQCRPYIQPSLRAPEWLYDTAGDTSMLTVQRVVTRDMFESPNRWVYYRSNQIDADAPTEGAGMYTYVNESTGDTSVQARGGRIITAVRSVDVADQPSLVQRAQQGIDADMRAHVLIELGTSPNPLHWHFDRVVVSDPDIGGEHSDVLVTQWALPLDGGNMTQTWQVI